MAKHTYYFKHDFNAHADEKIVDLLMSHGIEGYGIFWYLIELLASAEDYTLGNNYKRLAFTMRANEETLKSVVEDFSLFIVENDTFWSQSLADRMNKLDEIKKKRAENGKKGGLAKATKSVANAKQAEANAKQILAEESKGEERTEKKSKEELLLARELAFKDSLRPFVSDYGKEMIQEFYDYWREPNKSNSKMKWETGKTWDLNLRLKRWSNTSFSNKSSFNSPTKPLNNAPQYDPSQYDKAKDILSTSGQSVTAEDLERQYKNMKTKPTK